MSCLGSTFPRVFILLLAVALVASPGASAAAPAIKSIRCWPAGACPGGLKVPVGGHILIETSTRLKAARVRFTGRIEVGARRTRDGRVIAKVPASALPGAVRVRGEGTRWSGLSQVITPVAPGASTPPVPTGTAFDGNGMWIWKMPLTEGGNLERIIAKARLNDVTTLFIKSSDSDHMYPRAAPQFTSSLVRTLHSAGLKVCAWPFVYGDLPDKEAEMTVEAIRRGADCLAIDAEGQYEGKYSAAGRYVKLVRTAVGTRYPISLAGFPYVDYHPNFPYSVFLGRGAAQVNQPQAYWHDIGPSVDAVMAHTYAVNRPYGRVIVPIGQLVNVKSNREILRFRTVAAALGSPGVSWWDWQESKASQWSAVGSALKWPPPALAEPAWVALRRGSKGDLVRWAQQHLVAAGQTIKVTGNYDAATSTAVRSFQASRGLEPTGSVAELTWRALLRVPLPLPEWANPKPPEKPPVNVASTAPIQSVRTGKDVRRTPGRDEFRGRKRPIGD